MSEEYNYRDAFIHHRNAQNKFDYFFLGVILAALSLSIQSYDSSKELNFTFLIFSSWFLFLCSFLSGFLRQERLNLSYMIEAERMPQHKRKAMFEKAERGEAILVNSYSEDWSESEIKKNLEKVNEILNISESYLKKYTKHSLLAYQIQKWTFFYASLSYILFKVSNSINISILFLIIIFILAIIINIISILFYKHLLKKQ